MKAKCAFYLGLILVGISIIYPAGIFGYIVEAVGLFGLLLEAIKE